jgi:uncharacterized Zn finger protein (UPF0148 family)
MDERTKRAKRLAKYLTNELGWDVYDESRECTKCGHVPFRAVGKYCPECGAKTKLLTPASALGSVRETKGECDEQRGTHGAAGLAASH